MAEQTVSKKPRIWEIDALRGFLILCVFVAHALYCGQHMLNLYRLPHWLHVFLFTYAGSLFVILSGLSATLGSRSFRRGLLVFGGGMLLTVGSIVAAKLGFVDESFIIRFGVLHLLGLCMMLYPLLRRLSDLALLVFGVLVIGLGYWFATDSFNRAFPIQTDLFFMLGLHSSGFSSGDYFPVFPQLGWFCLGILLGRRFYARKTTHFPQVNTAAWPIRALCFLGRHTLPVFVVHLPIVGGLMYLLALVLH